MMIKYDIMYIVKEREVIYMTYYFFDEYGDSSQKKWFALEEEAEVYCEAIGAEYLCTD